MELYVYSPSLELRGYVQGISSCQVTLRYAGAGDITLECASTAENQALLTLGCYLALRQDRSMQAGQASQALRRRFDAFRIESVAWEAEEDGALLRIRGASLAGLLRLRVVDGVTTVSGNSVAAIHQLVQNNCVQPAAPARAFPFWRAETGAGGVSCQKQVAHEPLYETVCALAAAGGTGFAVDLLPAERTMLFYQYAGVDRSAGNRFGSFLLLDDRFGNLVSSSYLCDASESRTTALVLGEEQNGTRKKVVVGGEHKGLDRRELVVDAGDLHSSYTENGSQVTLTEAQYQAQLTTRGEEKLRDYPVQQRLDGEVPANAGLIFRKDYNLGDLVTVRNRSFGVRSTLRVTAVQECFDATGSRVVPVLGDETPALVERMARRMQAQNTRDLR